MWGMASDGACAVVQVDQASSRSAKIVFFREMKQVGIISRIQGEAIGIEAASRDQQWYHYHQRHRYKITTIVFTHKAFCLCVLFGASGNNHCKE